MPKSRELKFFGYSKSDYIDMFYLKDVALERMHILDCGGAFNSFVSEMVEENIKIISVDPMYDCSVEELTNKLNKNNKSSVKFLNDFKADKSKEDKQNQRYIAGKLPDLGFADESFDLALSSHFLFTHSDILSTEFHIKAVLELIRVSSEVRIFPVVDHTGNVSCHLGAVLQALQERDIDTELKTVNYGVVKDGNALLILDKSSCKITGH